MTLDNKMGPWTEDDRSDEPFVIEAGQKRYGKINSLLSHDFRGFAKYSYWTKPGKYKIQIGYKTHDEYGKFKKTYLSEAVEFEVVEEKAESKSDSLVPE